MKRSLRWQFLLPLFILLTIIFAGLYFYLSSTNLSIYETNLKNTMESEAKLLIEELSITDGSRGLTSDQQAIAFDYANTLNERVTIIQPDGVVLADSENDAALMENHMNRPEVQQAAAGYTGYQIRFSTTMQTKMLYVAVPVKENGDVIAIVRLARSLASIESDLRQMRITILVSGIIALILLLVISYIIFHKTTAPLSELTEAARLFPKGETRHIQIRENGNEIDELALAFNQMADQINQQIAVLREQKAKLGNILDQMQDGVVIVDRQGLVTSINPSAEEMFGVKADDVVGRLLIQSLHYYQILELMQKTLETKQQSSALIELTESHKHLNVLSSALEEPAEHSVMLLFQDMTRQKQLELMRREFVSNVSHELRTPLASLKALSETLQAGAIDDSQAAHHFVELMETEVDKLTQMVDELLTLSKIESGHAPLTLKPNTPGDIIHEAAARMSMQASRAHISLAEKYENDLPVILADCVQLERVLINLIHNAIKFTPPGGEIQVDAKGGNGFIIFSVKDNGSGIEAENLPRIFERFYKTDRSRASMGTGLGLSIVKHIVELHHGQVWVKSKIGEGSTFFFSIPVDQIHIN
jgi:two-component system phosphate regulon sensor histidine kinase PhoR